MGLRSPEPTLGVQRGCGDHQGHHLRIWDPSGAPRVSCMAGPPAHLHHLVPWHQLQGLRVPVKRETSLNTGIHTYVQVGLTHRI